MRATDVEKPARRAGPKPDDKLVLPTFVTGRKREHEPQAGRSRIQAFLMKASSPFWRLWNAYNSSLKVVALALVWQLVGTWINRRPWPACHAYRQDMVLLGPVAVFRQTSA